MKKPMISKVLNKARDTCHFTDCQEPEYRCLNGACVGPDVECNGTADCPDYSDEGIQCNSGRCPAISAICTTIAIQCQNEATNTATCGNPVARH